MARKPRIHFPGALYHVILRGNDRQDIFFDDGDHDYLFGLLDEGVKRFGYRVHAYCCMPNHLHLALQTGTVPLSRCVQNLAFRYTRSVNRRRGRIGHLFQGRYKAILVDADSYLAQLVRYIHLNPVRARMVQEPRDYPWSSHRAYLGENSVSWLTTDAVLGQFGDRAGVARRRYHAFVAAGFKEGHREEFHRGPADARVLGDDRFLQKVSDPQPIKSPAPTLREVISAVCDHYGVSAAELRRPGQQRLLAQARAVAGWLVIRLRCTTLTEASRRLGRDLTTLSSAVRRLDLRAQKNRALAITLKKLQSKWS